MCLCVCGGGGMTGSCQGRILNEEHNIKQYITNVEFNIPDS